MVMNGKRLITNDDGEHWVTYCLCQDCNAHLRSANYKAYNNVLNNEMEKRKKDFWQKVDNHLIKTLSVE